MKYPMIHLCLRVMDLDASEKFYQDAFGFEISRKKDFPDAKFTLSYGRRSKMLIGSKIYFFVGSQNYFYYLLI